MFEYRSLRHLFSAFLALVLFASSGLTPVAEANVWSERRTNAVRSDRTLLAQGRALPFAYRSPQLAIPASRPPSPLHSVQQVANRLSGSMGTVRLLHIPRTKDAPVVVLIQDVHRNAEAQMQISRIISDLVGSGVSLIGIEGAFGELPFASFRRGSTIEERRIAADFLLKSLYLAGPVHAALTAAGTAPILVGVDDPAAYRQNRQALHDSQKMFPSVNRRRLLWQADLQTEAERTFNAELKAYDALVRAHRAGEIEWFDYVRELSRRHGAAGPSIRLFLETAELEKQLDFAHVEKERTVYLRRLAENASERDVRALAELGDRFRSGGVPPLVFYRTLIRMGERAGVPFERDSPLARYLGYLANADRLDAESLLDETTRLEKQIFDRLCRSPLERRIVKDLRLAHLTERLLRLDLSQDEWDEFEASAGGIQPALEVEAEPFLAFYREAEKRDASMARRMLSEMRRRNVRVAVLVAGGFHRAGIAARLRAAGAGLVSLAPRLSKGQSDSESYLSAFAQEKTPLESLFNGDRLFLSGLSWTGPQRLLAAFCIAVRRLFLIAGRTSPQEFGKTVSELLDTRVSGLDARVTAQSAYVSANGEPVAEFAMSSAGRPQSVRLSDGSRRPVSIRELGHTLRLVRGRAPLIDFLRLHLFADLRMVADARTVVDAFLIRLRTARALQRASWTALVLGTAVGIAGAVLLGRSFSPAIGLVPQIAFLLIGAAAGSVGLLVGTQVSLHELQIRLFPEAPLTIPTPGQSNDPAGIAARLVEELRKIPAHDVEQLANELDKWIRQAGAANALEELLARLRSNAAAHTHLSAMGYDDYLLQIVGAMDQAYKYIWQPKAVRQEMKRLAANPDSFYPAYAAGMFEVLDRTASLHMAVRFLFEFHTDQDKVGQDIARRTRRAYGQLDPGKIKAHLVDLPKQLEFENLEPILRYELHRWQTGGREEARTTNVIAEPQVARLKVDPRRTQNVSCPICSRYAGRIRPSSEVLVGDVVLNRTTVMNLVQCESHGIAWLNPQPDDTYLDQLYDAGYFEPMADTEQAGIRAFSPEEEERRRRIAELQVLEWTRLFGIEFHRGRLLDVGPGSGNLLEAAAKSGYEAVGLDVSPYIVERLTTEKNLSVVQGTLEEFAAGPWQQTAPEGFDVISMYDLFEHVRDPNATLAAVRTILHPGGYIVMRTPNNVAHPPKLHLLDHFWHYTPESLTLLLESHGFKVVEIKPSGIFSTFDGRTLENMTVVARFEPNTPEVPPAKLDLVEPSDQADEPSELDLSRMSMSEPVNAGAVPDGILTDGQPAASLDAAGPLAQVVRAAVMGGLMCLAFWSAPSAGAAGPADSPVAAKADNLFEERLPILLETLNSQRPRTSAEMAELLDAALRDRPVSLGVADVFPASSSAPDGEADAVERLIQSETGMPAVAEAAWLFAYLWHRVTGASFESCFFGDRRRVLPQNEVITVHIGERPSRTSDDFANLRGFLSGAEADRQHDVLVILHSSRAADRDELERIRADAAGLENVRVESLTPDERWKSGRYYLYERVLADARIRFGERLPLVAALADGGADARFITISRTTRFVALTPSLRSVWTSLVELLEGWAVFQPDTLESVLKNVAATLDDA